MAFGNCKLGYLAIETRKPEKWRAFNARLLDLPICVNADGSIGLQIDGARQRLIIVPGERDDVLPSACRCRTRRRFDDLSRRLAASGIATQTGDTALCEARGVGRHAGVRRPLGRATGSFRR